MKIDNFIAKIENSEYFERIAFIFLYGSQLSDYHLKESDIDICIFINDNTHNLNRIRLDLLSNFPDNFDIQMFQLLPTYIYKLKY